jgi:hypothetical protein
MNSVALNQLFDKALSAMSVTPVCPRCKRTIPSDDINVANDIAFCRNCNLSHSLSALATGTAVDEDVDVNNPPAGAWYDRDGNGIKFGATHRSFGQAFGLLLFAAFWNAIVSVFVALAAASTLQHLGVPRPAWVRGADWKYMPIGMLIFLWLFLIPFVTVGLGMLGAFLNCLLGRTELRIEGGECVLYTGIGPLGRRRQFSVSEVTDVRIESSAWRSNNGSYNRNTRIVIATNEKPINFGSSLSNARRRFIAGAARKELVRR